MASWMVHLRIADRLLDRISDLIETEFVVGNIAPDSGIPNEDWSNFTPSSAISHFKITSTDGLKKIDIEKYIKRYLSEQQRKEYNKKQRSFYLGYFTHLLTDIMWADEIVRPKKEQFRTLYEKDKTAWIWEQKKDWYDLDFLFLKKYPSFRAFAIYQNAVGFQNEYLDFFSKEAFDNRREYITNFYQEKREGLEREYPFLTENEMDQFVNQTSKKIEDILNDTIRNQNYPEVNP